MKYSTTNSMLISPDIEEDIQKDTQPKNHPLILLLKLTGLYFGARKDGCFWYYFGIFRALTLFFLLSYQAGYMGYYLFSLSKPDEKTTTTIFIFSFKVQAALATMFIIYWQCRGYIDYLFANITWPSDQDRATLKSIKLTIMFMSFSMSLFTVIFGLLNYFVATEQYEYLITNIEAMDAYGLKNLRYLFILISYLGAGVWLIVQIFYIIFCIILYGIFIRFNQELEEIEQDSSKLSEQLLDKYIKYIQMARMVRTIDSTFEVYNFCMMGLNIPTTIFYLISLITSTTWKNTILILPAPIFCCFQLIGLTAIPARIHTAIQEVRNILYKNANIWKPYDGKTYQIASVFVSHIDHANLGISVWGFAIVTKPLILTTISLIITYLTILLQLQINKGGEFSSDATHNISGPDF